MLSGCIRASNCDLVPETGSPACRAADLSSATVIFLCVLSAGGSSGRRIVSQYLSRACLVSSEWPSAPLRANRTTARTPANVGFMLRKMML